MWEIAENLHRAELTKLQRAEQIEEWRKLSVQLVQSKHPADHGVSAAAETLGVSRADVKRAEAIAGISEDAKDAAQDAGIDDNQSALLKVAAEPPERQVAKVRELVLPKTDQDVIEQQYTALMSAWNRACPEARQRFREFTDEPVMDKRFG